MITYLKRPDSSQIKLNSDTKSITTIINNEKTKVITHMDDFQNYDIFVATMSSFTVSDETSFNTTKTAVLTLLGNV